MCAGQIDELRSTVDGPQLRNMADGLKAAMLRARGILCAVYCYFAACTRYAVCCLLYTVLFVVYCAVCRVLCAVCCVLCAMCCYAACARQNQHCQHWCCMRCSIGSCLQSSAKGAANNIAYGALCALCCEGATNRALQGSAIWVVTTCYFQLTG